MLATGEAGLLAETPALSLPSLPSPHTPYHRAGPVAVLGTSAVVKHTQVGPTSSCLLAARAVFEVRGVVLPSWMT